MKAAEARTRVQVNRILFLTDFSKAAAAAIPYAAGIAKRFGAKIYALHVQTPVVNPMTPPTTWAVLERAAEVETKAQQKTLIESFPQLKPEVMIGEGDLLATVESVVEKEKIDLIVLGTRGRSGAGKFFMGSTAEEIFRMAHCAVLTVGPLSPEEPPRDSEFTEILYATDFSPESNAAASYAISLAQEFQAHLTLLHVIANAKPSELVRPADLVKCSEQILCKLVPPEAKLWCEPNFMVEQGPAAETILEVASRKRPDLIVLGVHRRDFAAVATHLTIAIAHKVVTHATCPVLTVRG
jgi:nucleotide-binding universal stress UspA family protein